MLFNHLGGQSAAQHVVDGSWVSLEALCGGYDGTLAKISSPDDRKHKNFYKRAKCRPNAMLAEDAFVVPIFHIIVFVKIEICIYFCTFLKESSIKRQP